MELEHNWEHNVYVYEGLVHLQVSLRYDLSNGGVCGDSSQDFSRLSG